MKNLYLIAICLNLILFACNNQEQKRDQPINNEQIHKILVKEVLQAQAYTYLFVNENDKDFWVVGPVTETQTGSTLYFKGGMQVNDFESKDLKKKFSSILFLDKLSESPNGLIGSNEMGHNINPNLSPHQNMGNKVNLDVPKSEIKKFKLCKTCISIAEIFEKKDKLAGKLVKLTGQVVKYNPEILNKNWLHIQDGTNYNGKFDLTITSQSEFKVGDVVTIEGTLALDKDLGHGYVYEILLEDAKVK